MNPNAGGVAFLVHKSMLGQAPASHFTPCASMVGDSNLGPGQDLMQALAIVPGRVLRIVINSKDSILGGSFDGENVFYAIHNEKITAPEINKIEKQIKNDRDKVALAPHKYALHLLGDFNLEHVDSKRIVLTNPIAPWMEHRGEAAPTAIAQSRPLQRRWQAIFDVLVEVSPPVPTHINIQDLSINNIDRIFTSIPKSNITHLKMEVGVCKDPMWFYTNHISDHAPTWWSIQLRKLQPVGSLRLKPEWCKHPVFKEHMDYMTQFNTFHGDMQIYNDTFGDIHREAATLARNAIFADDPDGDHCMLLRLGTISNVCAHGLAGQAKSLMRVSALARKYICFVDGMPTITPRDEF